MLSWVKTKITPCSISAASRIGGRISRENEECRRERNDAAVHSKPIRYGSHSVLANAKVQVAPCITPTAARGACKLPGLVTRVLENRLVP